MLLGLKHQAINTISIHSAVITVLDQFHTILLHSQQTNLETEITLTHYGLVTPYGNTELGQH